MNLHAQKKFFVTATDTDAGKTYICCQLLNYFKALNFKAQALKPLASGAIKVGEELVYGDIAALKQHNFDSKVEINYKSFPEPIAPHIAAIHHNELLSAKVLAEFCKNESLSKFDYLFIEGAGGIAVPLNKDETWIDFLEIMQIPVILVVGIKLGCINHGLLSDFYLKQQDINYVGWIANCLEPQTLKMNEIISTLSEKMHAPLLTIVDYCGKITAIDLF